MNDKFLRCALLAIAAISNGYSQASYEGLQKITPSSLLDDVQARAKQAPKLSPPVLADFANKKLAVSGFEFEFDPCDAQSTATKIKYPAEFDGSVYHIYDGVDRVGSTRQFLASQPEDAPCGCWINLPLTAATSKGIVVVSNKGPLEIRPPDKFLFEENQLMDVTLRKSKTKWLVPDGGPPDAISVDGRRLYRRIAETPLFLEIADVGTLKFVPSSSPGIITRFTDLKKFPKDPNNDYLGFRRFSGGGKVYTVKFSHICT